MPTKAFVLVETAIGKTNDVLVAMKLIPGVMTADAVTGPYDLIITVEGTDHNAIGILVTNKVHSIPGIVRTMTCFAVRL